MRTHVAAVAIEEVRAGAKAAGVALCHTAVIWLLPLTEGSLLAIAALCLTSLLLIDRRSRSAVALVASGSILAAALAVWVVVDGRAEPRHLWISILAVIPWALLTPGLALGTELRVGRAAAVALLLVSVVPSTANTMHLNGWPPWGASATDLLALASPPDEARMSEYLAWARAGDRERLFEAGSDVYRNNACMMIPDGCPALPDAPAGTPESTAMSCSAVRGQCRWIQVEATAEGRVAWVVTTDLQGRFRSVEASPHEASSDATWWPALLLPAGTVLLWWSVLTWLLKVEPRRG